MKPKLMALMACLIAITCFSGNALAQNEAPTITADITTHTYTYNPPGRWVYVWGTVIDDDGGWNCDFDIATEGVWVPSFLDPYGNITDGLTLGTYLWVPAEINSVGLRATDPHGEITKKMLAIPF